MKVAVVGATGIVGQEMLKLLVERKFPYTEIYPVGSERSQGKTVEVDGKDLEVKGIKEVVDLKPDLALFSAGKDVALEWASAFAEAGTTVVDNSAAFRMDDDKKLIVPEINGNILSEEDKIIANPNCSTIQMVMAINPLHEKYKINRIVVATYQAVSGSGKEAVDQLNDELNNREGKKAYHYEILNNCIPHCGGFLDNNYTSEETKLVYETQKIVDPNIWVTATAVRIPVFRGHSEAVNITFNNEFDILDVRNILKNSPGIVIYDNIEENLYPMPKTSENKDEVFIGRLRRDFSLGKSLNMWVVSDNLRKGAATNAIQIAEYLRENKLL
ncbi:MAG: aspartate-semialdehyde dehydrogenase [Bacteroidales bacterium]